jgi:1-acyl-sn-glycerol-3-phosphate acyltransferase
VSEATALASERAGDDLDREATRVVFARRLTTVPAFFALALLSLLAAPLWIPGAALCDATRSGTRAALRCCTFFCWYFWCQCFGTVGSFAIWLLSGVWAGASRRRFLDWNFKLQCWWAPALFWGAARIFGFRVEVEGEEAIAGSPVLLLIRHVSNADTLLPTVVVQIPTGLRFRYVMKRELLWDPCIDIVGNRLPNCFVRRDSGDSAREARAIARLVEDIGPGEGVVIYPEGTRFTREKRQRVLTRLRERGPAELAARAEKLENLLPPKPAGALALLENNPGADALFCAHTGFEDAGRLADLWSGSLVGKQIRVRFWRVPYAEIPTGRDARIDWLFDHWARIDDWITAATNT